MLQLTNGQQFVYKDQIFKSSKYTLDPVIDRVGAGDSFAAGLIWGLIIIKTIFKKL